MVLGVWQNGTYCVPRLALSSRDEQRVTVRDDSFGDGGDLGRSFAYAEDYFGETLPEIPVVVDPCEAQIFVWRSTQRLEDPVGRGGWIDRAVADPIEQST